MIVAISVLGNNSVFRIIPLSPRMVTLLLSLPKVAPLSLVEFSVYKPNVENAQNHELITILNKVTLELPSNKVYKLLAESGGGKTTFLKALTNNWQYTDGTVSLPASAEGNTCFIPQHLFLPEGTLLEIISYLSNSQLEKNPLLSPKSNKVESKEEIIEIIQKAGFKIEALEQ